MCAQVIGWHLVEEATFLLLNYDSVSTKLIHYFHIINKYHPFCLFHIYTCVCVVPCMNDFLYE